MEMNQNQNDNEREWESTTMGRTSVNDDETE